jgi:hypothetical protein
MLYDETGLMLLVKCSHLKVIWHVVRRSSNFSLMLPAGAVSERYEAKYIDVNTDDKAVTAKLVVHQTSPEDLVNYCYLEVMNELGRAEFQFRLQPMPEPTVDPNLLMVNKATFDDDEGGGGDGGK